MVSTMIDTKKKWVFHWDSLVKNEIPIELKEKEGTITFSLPLDEKKILEIKLFSFKEKEGVIHGQYTIIGSGCVEGVIFKVVEAGRLLRGTPKGSFSRFAWAISSQ